MTGNTFYIMRTLTLTFLLHLLHLASHPSLVFPLMRFLSFNLSFVTIILIIIPIPTAFLKQCSHILLPIIPNIINQSISTGTFPYQFNSSY